MLRMNWRGILELPGWFFASNDARMNRWINRHCR